MILILKKGNKENFKNYRYVYYQTSSKYSRKY